jgi:acetyltransferase-like isoleucine patch superfamily enzyme
VVYGCCRENAAALVRTKLRPNLLYVFKDNTVPGSAQLQQQGWRAITKASELSLFSVVTQLEPQDIDRLYKETDYLRTNTSNLISRAADIKGASNVRVKGKVCASNKQLTSLMVHCQYNLIHYVALVPVQSIVKPGAVMRGDLASIRIGRYCSVGDNSIIQPGTRIADDNLQEGVEPIVQYTPVLIGDHTVIGTGCISEAAAIGCCVVIGDHCKLVSFAFS